jgi:serine/threonine-protein kinase
LPGGDPLAAALAAGETPSPEAVAAAPTKGLLSPVFAFASLGAVVVVLALFIFLLGKTQFQNLIPMESRPKCLPIVRERSTQVSATLHGRQTRRKALLGTRKL